MDPASIVGLIVTGCKLSLTLYDTTTVTDAPEEISSIRAEISALNVALGQLDGWVTSASPKAASSSIEEEISKIVAACQETYTGLDELISSNPQPSLWTRIMWIKNGPNAMKTDALPLQHGPGNPDNPLSSTDCSWAEVLASMEAASHQYKVKANNAKLRAAQRNRTVAVTLQSLAEMIPEQDGLSVSRGGLNSIENDWQRVIGS
ncbi:hypothetical protein QQX98_011011 [Neonectria punicea]|uniref:Fungal N-terminal domain-containing protein n=1 Tax=Neonectria punicea TaxID=979145 RepID=A0ABR1GMZ4_9HYPO